MPGPFWNAHLLLGFVWIRAPPSQQTQQSPASLRRSPSFFQLKTRNGGDLSSTGLGPEVQTATQKQSSEPDRTMQANVKSSSRLCRDFTWIAFKVHPFTAPLTHKSCLSWKLCVSRSPCHYSSSNGTASLGQDVQEELDLSRWARWPQHRFVGVGCGVHEAGVTK